MSTLCVIGARGGSKGVNDKNIRPLLGKPLIAWSIEQALACPHVDEVIVSTDSDRIADIAAEHGAWVPFRRPDSLAGDTVGKWAVWQHALEESESTLDIDVDLFVDLDCTNPLRDVDDISRAIAQFRAGDADAVFSICEARKNPYFNMVEERDGRLQICAGDGGIVRRQDAPRVFEHVASIYVLSPRYLRTAGGLLEGKAVGYDIGAEKSFDLDSEFDFMLIEYLMTRRLEDSEHE